MFIETVRNFISEIILAITSIGILTVLTVGISYAIKHLDVILPPLFGMIGKKVKPVEEKVDQVLESNALVLEGLAYLFKDKAESPLLAGKKDEYKREKYLEYAGRFEASKNILLKLKEINVTENVEKAIDRIEEVYEEIKESTSFLGE